MIFTPTRLEGVFHIIPDRQTDSRGYFARVFCQREFAEHGLHTQYRQHAISHNETSGTLRGLHFQRHPDAEIKLIQCVRGIVFDVVVDVRRGSPSFGKWLSFTLSAQNGDMLYVPEGCAHGFQTLSDDAMVHYCISTEYNVQSSSGIRWNDPKLGIIWPRPVTVISERDRTLPSLEALM